MSSLPSLRHRPANRVLVSVVDDGNDRSLLATENRRASKRRRSATDRSFGATKRFARTRRLTKIEGVSARSASDRLLSFWYLQLIGWTLYAAARVVAFLPYRHMPGEFAYQVTLAGACAVSSLILHRMGRVLWRRSVPFLPSLLTCVPVACILGILAAALALDSERHAVQSPRPFSWPMAVAGGVEATAILLAWTALYFGIKHYLRSEEQSKLLLASQISLRDSQLQALRYQLHPHFLFNTLNAISSLIITAQPEIATRVVSKLAGLLRSTLEAPEMHYVSLADELLVIEEYLAIEKIRFGKRLDVRFSIDPDVRDVKVPRFILQPLIENAIKHGVSKRSTGGSIRVRATRVDASLHLQIENEMGQALPSFSETGYGVGLRNTRERINQLYGSSGLLAATVREPEHFTVYLTLPLDTEGSSSTRASGSET